MPAEADRTPALLRALEPAFACVRATRLLSAPERRGVHRELDELVAEHLRALRHYGGPTAPLEQLEYTPSALPALHLAALAWEGDARDHAATARTREAPLAREPYRGAPAPSGLPTAAQRWLAALERAAHKPPRARAGALEREALRVARACALASPVWRWAVQQLAAPASVPSFASYPFEDEGLEVATAAPTYRSPYTVVLANPVLEPLVLHVRAVARGLATAERSPWLPVLRMYALGAYPLATPRGLVVWTPPRADAQGRVRLDVGRGLAALFNFGADHAALVPVARPARYRAPGFAPPPFVAITTQPPVVVEGPLPPPELPQA